MSAQSATYVIEHRPAPACGPRLIENGVLGMLLFVFAETMMFAGLVSAHSIVRSRAFGAMWPPYGQPRLPIEQTAVNTAALMVSGIVLVLAYFTYRREASSARLPLLGAILLGAFFVGFQGVEWIALIDEGLTLTSSTYGGFFYLIVGMHGVHAVAALLGMTWAWVRLERNDLSASQLATVSVFWYFVVLLWPVLYLKVYP